MLLLRLLAAVIVFVSIELVKCQFNFNRPKFQQSGLYELDSWNITGRFVVGFADANADSFTDLLTFNSAEREFRAHYWNRKEFQFNGDSSSELLFRLTSTESLVNAVPADFDYDGHMDVLVQLEKSLYIYYGPSFTDFRKLNDGSSSTDAGQPAAVDLNGDLSLDLIGRGQTWSLNPQTSDLRSYSNKPFNSKICPAHPDIAISFVDLNGDCSADLFIVCADLSYQIWLNQNDPSQEFGFALYKPAGAQDKLPTGTFSVQFADLNNDGTLDALISYCESPSKCQLQISFNRQMPLCASSLTSSQENCRQFSSLCSPDNSFALFTAADLLNVDLNTITSGFISTFSSSSYGVKYAVPRIGDINLDGYPDLLIVGSGSAGSIPVILRNEKSAEFSVWNDDQTKILMSYTATQQAFLVDFDEKGSLDILLITQDSKQQLRTIAIYNNLYFDAFFLKVYTSNGVCHKNCIGGDSIKTKPLAANYPGATFKYSVLDPSGRKRFGTGAQLSQTTHGSMQHPFVLVGLGRTNNYIEDFSSGVSGSQPDTVFQAFGLIPNSKLLIHPPTSTLVKSRHEQWIMELFINPGDYVKYVFLVLFVGAILLGGIVIALKIMENRQDIEERKHTLHAINFDAL